MKSSTNAGPAEALREVRAAREALQRIQSALDYLVSAQAAVADLDQTLDGLEKALMLKQVIHARAGD
jgi:hypothetical protein